MIQVKTPHVNHGERVIDSAIIGLDATRRAIERSRGPGLHEYPGVKREGWARECYHEEESYGMIPVFHHAGNNGVILKSFLNR